MLIKLNKLEIEYLKMQIIRIDICDNCGRLYPKWTNGSKGVHGKTKKNIRRGNSRTCSHDCAEEHQIKSLKGQYKPKSVKKALNRLRSRIG